MTKILFVCHGNICRSPMAEYFMKDIVRREGLEKRFEIASAATSREEIGNDVYPPARRTLVEYGISCPRRAARQLTRADFEEYDLIIGMDSENERGMRRICGDGDAERYACSWTTPTAPAMLPIRGTPVTLKQPGAMCPMAAAPCWKA